MSYRITYLLETDSDHPEATEIIQQLAQHACPQVPGRRESAKEWESILTASAPTTWDDNQQDMQRLSRKWPETTFTLYSQGQEPTDNRTTIFRAGAIISDTKVPNRIF